MNILITLLLIIAGIILLILFVAFFMKKQHYVSRMITIDAPAQKIYDYLKLLKNQDAFNKNASAGAERKKEFKGTDGTIGYIYAWSGDKNAGVGEKEIKNLVEGKKIEVEIRFIKPMTATASIIVEIEALSSDQSRVYWSNGGNLNYPLNALIPVMEKSVARDMDSSLLTLKNILEK